MCFSISESAIETGAFGISFFVHETGCFGHPERCRETRGFFDAFMISRNYLYLSTVKCTLKPCVSISIYITLILVISFRIRTGTDTTDFLGGFFPTGNISIFGVKQEFKVRAKYH